MADATTQFFEALAARGHEPALEKASGSLRLDLTNGRRTATWRVTITRGDIAVSHAAGPADCVARADKTTFDGMVSGRINALAALLRGTIEVEGSPELLVQFQRLFPGPPRARRRGPVRRKR